MKIKIIKPSEEYLKERGISNWPIWTKEVSQFNWYYDETEECYILEGKVVIELEDGGKVEINPGDFVTFEKGLSCKWNVIAPVKKHYNFK